MIVLLPVILSLAALAPPQARDAPADSTPKGSATISGTVVSDEAASVPLGGALVTIRGDVAQPDTVVTDSSGRFTFDHLGAGRYSLTARKAAFVTTEAGARRPAEPGQPLSVAAGQRLTDVTIRLARGAVITGIVRDEFGAPIPDVSVVAVPESGSAPRPGQAPTPATDDRGAFRLFGLAPGEYYVVATLPSALTSGDIGLEADDVVDATLARLERRGAAAPGLPARESVDPASSPARAKVPAYGFAPIFFPGVTAATDAEVIHLAAGDVRADVNVTMRPIPVMTLDGTVAGPPNVMSQLALSLDTDSSLPLSMQSIGTFPVLAMPPGADGRFRYTTVAPGRYRLIARAQTAGLWGSVDVVVAADDVNGVTVALQPMLRLTGRMVVERAAESDRLDLKTVRLILSPPGNQTTITINGTMMGLPPVPAPRITDTGDVEFAGIIAGTYELRAVLPPGSAWWLRSGIVDGKDILDFPLSVASGGDLAGAVFTVTDRHSEVSGRLQNPAGAGVAGYDVVIFPADRAYWRAGARRVRVARPATDGFFAVRDLPAGSYLLAALTDVDPATAGAPEFLDQIAGAAIPLTVTDGGKTVQDVLVK